MLGEPGWWSRGVSHFAISPFLFVQSAPAMARIDLNADVGESFGAYSIGQDAQLMGSITSANIAAGFHAGDPSVLRATIRAARAHGVAVGAHPSFPDLAGFGRREMTIDHGELEDIVLYQLAAVTGVAAAEGLALQHVKPHGALYNMAARDRRLADAVARAIASIGTTLSLVGLHGSALLEAGRDAGLRVVAEAFVDRAYNPDGSLVSRQQPGAVIHAVDDVVARALRLATEGEVITLDGSVLRLDVETICVHGDTPGAALLAARVRSGLESAGVEVKAFAS
jgi:UPF0271 protein